MERDVNAPRPLKVLFDCPVPFPLAHGGQQVQIEQTRTALERIGVQVEPLRWWDGSQTGSVLHYFGRIPLQTLELARQKGMRVVFSDLLTEQASRSGRQLFVQKLGNRLLSRLLPGATTGRLGWKSYQLADACLALTAWEAQLMRELFACREEILHVVPNGVEELFLHSKKSTRGPWLVCTAAITERKRVLELAQAAVASRVQVWFIGEPYANSADYAQRFVQLTKEHPSVLRYEGGIRERERLAEVYREARGFVLLSTMESLSLSALEAAACECPLLLSDLRWARWMYGEKASYCQVTDSSETTGNKLRDFYDRAPALPLPPKPLSWLEIAQKLKGIYERTAVGVRPVG